MWIVSGYFQLCEMNVFRSFFAFRLEMHVRCDNQYKTRADRENILGQPMLPESMGICVLSPAHESEMRGYLVYELTVKYLLILFKFSHSILDQTALLRNFWGIFGNIFRGVCGPYHLQGLCSESALFYLLQSGHRVMRFSPCAVFLHFRLYAVFPDVQAIKFSVVFGGSIVLHYTLC